jgi:hypothetical protein
MALVFLNGGEPNYTGATFMDSTTLLNLIRDTLVSAGWTSLVENPGVSIYLQGTSIDNSYPCYIQFYTATNTGVTNGRYLYIRGWQTYTAPSTFTTASPDVTLFLQYIEGSSNRLWITADQESGCMCIFDATGISRSFHFGFLQRIELTDPWAWMIGYIHSMGYQYCYVAKSKINNTNWRKLSDDYYNYPGTNDNYQVMPFSTYDLLARGKPYNQYQDGNTSNAFRYAHQGRANYNGQAVIDPYYYIEGRGNSAGWSTTAAFYFRGLVKFTYCGVASFDSGAWCIEPDTGYRIMSTGSTNWQGMRIL